jgi:hypothetical protein
MSQLGPQDPVGLPLDPVPSSTFNQKGMLGGDYLSILHIKLILDNYDIVVSKEKNLLKASLHTNLRDQA